MQSALTVRDLLLTGEPLHPSEVVAGEGGLSNAVSWVVSLRPYPPAFPQLRGGELALVAAEHLSRLDPPVTLVEAMRYLVQRGASGVAVRGEMGEISLEAVSLAHEYSFPLLRLLTDTPLQDIEQAVMRECALHEARREMQPSHRQSWAESLLAGRFGSLSEAQSLPRKQGHTLASHYAVAYISPPEHRPDAVDNLLPMLEEAYKSGSKPGASMPLALPYGQGVAVLLPQGCDVTPLWEVIGGRAACGIGTEKPALDAPASLEEAQMAALASALLRKGAPTRYTDLGADRLLLILYRDHPDDLRAFVEETIGPLLRHDARSTMPLLPTVEAFIRHSGRLRETAEEICVHRNTLAYRLERAAEILGVDMKDAEARLSVELALRALPLTGTSVAKL